MTMRRQRIVGMVLFTLIAFSPPVWSAEWHVPGDFATIQQAIDSTSVVNGDRIVVGSGSHAGALVNKGVEIRGEEGATITSGPVHGSGMIQGFRLIDGSDGTTISHLRFTVDLAIMNAGGRTSPGPGVGAVSVNYCTFINPVQAISNWGGSGWDISQNHIIDLRTNCGGGIGVLVADYLGRAINDNVIAHNKISGTLHVNAGDCGGYNGTGIVLYADFRWGMLGASEIAWNRVVKNTIGLTSDNPGVVDVVAIELTDTQNPPGVNVIQDNTIGFNDLRGTVLQLDLTPDNLDGFNSISRNLGDSRGHGLHPSVFGPGGS